MLLSRHQGTPCYLLKVEPHQNPVRSATWQGEIPSLEAGKGKGSGKKENHAISDVKTRDTGRRSLAYLS